MLYEEVESIDEKEKHKEESDEVEEEATLGSHVDELVFEEESSTEEEEEMEEGDEEEDEEEGTVHEDEEFTELTKLCTRRSSSRSAQKLINRIKNIFGLSNHQYEITTFTVYIILTTIFNVFSSSS